MFAVRFVYSVNVNSNTDMMVLYTTDVTCCLQIHYRYMYLHGV